MTSVRPTLKPDTLKVLTAWDTRTGRTVYRTATGDWADDLASAAILKGEAADTEMEVARGEEHLVFDPYFMEVTNEGFPGGRETLRETIRVQGPTTRLDLGRQAANN